MKPHKFKNRLILQGILFFIIIVIALSSCLAPAHIKTKANEGRLIRTMKDYNHTH